VSYLGNNNLPFNPLATSGKPRDAQRFNGNGSTTTFTLTHPVTNPTDLEVFVENVQQEPSFAYDATGTQLIFTEAPPSGTNNVYVIYRNIEPGIFASIPDGAITFNKLANNIRLFTTDNFTGDNTTVTFGLSSAVPDANTLIVAVDGVFQRAPIHYTASGNTITFASAPPATSNVHVRHLGFRTTQSITALPANTTISQPILQNPQITSQAVFAAGSNTAPSITAAGDTNTGIYFPAADTIAFTEGGVESARIDSSGNMGIGTSSPSTRLEVKSGGNVNLKVSTDSNAYSFLTLNAWALDRAQIRAEAANPGSGSGAGSGTMTFFTANNSALAARGAFDGSGNFQFNSGYGSIATAFGCRAWVNFNGTGTVAIRASGNVSSITDNGTGDYTINFSNAMPDANYAAGAMGALDEGGAAALISGVSVSRTSGQNAGSFRVQTYYFASSSNVQEDFSKVLVAIFR